ncbi:RagB/SusD family nutrient uptake outer membrane protein [Pedobacter petrophilus]|uniref:RagB/SusD family nutrient uptake outer membrane protein n=1 Tax=Pedobacter petrophilus TaxID=1908241 RepID=A0A7K0G4Z2_9SPHI|nr:RagB/SusD family nutrient uptake outer membrane protein [Pedobacter petrophilus]MRX78875.1 RagB/SusD family nutrient uptake outer membrane protein [Pedobacter petrophilus]
MKKIFYIIIIGVTISGCKKTLDLQPLDTISSTNFLTNEAEIKLGLTGVYNGAQWNYGATNTPLLKRIEAATDFGLSRKGSDQEDLMALGDNGPFVNGNAIPASAWSNAYALISRTNSFLEGMKAGETATPTVAYKRMRSEALVLRAWSYYHLMVWFGDVPFFTAPLAPSEYDTQKRISKALITARLYQDLDEAWGSLPAQNDRGRVNKGVAYGLKAKIAMLMKDYQTAANTAKAVIDANTYSLNPTFNNLFSLAGQNANAGNEILFMTQLPSDNANPLSYLQIGLLPRQVLGTSGNNYPNQAMVDKFECTDGKRIDQSPLYDPANPSKNRDKRLGWTIFMPGDEINVATGANASLPYQNPVQRIQYNIYSDIVIRYNWTTNAFVNVAGNPDYVSSTNSVWQFGSTGAVGGVGYCWRKYIDPAQNAFAGKSGYILMRYADILLTYAEAKIELNQVDATVTSAINLVRTRASQPITILGTQDVLRQLVRRERAVEFAMEGVRFIDLIRWGIYNDAVNGPIVGAAKNPTDVPAIPSFGAGVKDLNDIPDYTSSASKRISSRNQTRLTTSKHTLWPIPQGEIDKNQNLIQNPGW